MKKNETRISLTGHKARIGTDLDKVKLFMNTRTEVTGKRRTWGIPYSPLLHGHKARHIYTGLDGKFLHPTR